MKVVYIIIFILILTSSALSSSWDHPLYVGGGGYWKARIPVQILNHTDKAMAGTPIFLTIGTDHGELEMVGEPAASVRVCDESGSEYLFDIVRSDGSWARDGIIEAGDRLVVPVECSANSSKTYYVYFRNLQAWPVPDFFEASPRIRNSSMENGEGRPSGWAFDDSTSSKLPEIRVGEKEEMELAVEPGADSWVQTEGREFSRRIPLGILNFAEEVIEDRLIYARLDPRLKMGQNGAMPLLVDSGSKTQPYILLGDGIMFFGRAAARSIAEYNAYFPDNGDAGAGKLLTYESLIDHPANLVRNYSFEDGDVLPGSWRKGPGEKGKRVSPGFLGSYCVRLDVEANDPLGWVGWRQEVPVEPDTSYFYGCYVRTENVDGQIKLHAHFHDASGDLSKEGGFFATSSSLQGTSDWTLLSSMLRTPGDTASVELHLTMNTRGTVWHDGVVLCEVTEASSGYIEHKDSKELTDYVVWQVNPLAKVFQEDPFCRPLLRKPRLPHPRDC